MRFVDARHPPAYLLPALSAGRTYGRSSQEIVIRTARLAVFASGGGTNLQSLLDSFNGTALRAARVELVVGGRSGIGALDRAAVAGVPSVVVDPRGRPEDEVAAEMLSELEAHGIDIVVLAGYIRLVPLRVVERFEGRMLNIHPALLPAFGGSGMYGERVHRAVIEAGSRVSGATVHLVGARYDEGPIVAQWPVPVLPGDTPDTLAKRVLRAEHKLLPAAVEQLAQSLFGGVPDSREANGPSGATDYVFELREGDLPSEASLLQLNRKKDS